MVGARSTHGIDRKMRTKILVGRHEAKKQLRSSRSRREDIRMDIR
jgi:hypothetical protein